MMEEQKTQGASWTPSKVIARLGKEINNEDSIYYWAQKNDIPVRSSRTCTGMAVVCAGSCGQEAHVAG